VSPKAYHLGQEEENVGGHFLLIEMKGAIKRKRGGIPNRRHGWTRGRGETLQKKKRQG